MISVARECQNCKKYSQSPVSETGEAACGYCSQKWAPVDVATVFQICPFCQCRQFYVQKDFNRLIGCGVVALGIVLVPVTYGLSLPFFALIDWFIYRRVKTVAVCYQCETEYRGFEVPAHFKAFLHHIGEKYEREREKLKASH